MFSGMGTATPPGVAMESWGDRTRQSSSMRCKPRIRAFKGKMASQREERKDQKWAALQQEVSSLKRRGWEAEKDSMNAHLCGSPTRREGGTRSSGGVKDELDGVKQERDRIMEDFELLLSP